MNSAITSNLQFEEKKTRFPRRKLQTKFFDFNRIQILIKSILSCERVIRRKERNNQRQKDWEERQREIISRHTSQKTIARAIKDSLKRKTSKHLNNQESEQTNNDNKSKIQEWSCPFHLLSPILQAFLLTLPPPQQKLKQTQRQDSSSPSRKSSRGLTR